MAAVAMAASMFAAEPASNPSVVEFTGDASVTWGVNLDTNKTGFKNDESASFKMKLFDTGTKSTSGDGIWAELKIKIEDDDGVGPNGVNNGVFKGKAAAVDAAMFHINDFYIGIRSGDTQTGELDMNTALRSAGFWQNPGRWLENVGPADYSQGITAGYGNNNFDVAVDFRSAEATQYSNDYAIAAEAKLKDSNEWVGGLDVRAGVSYGFNGKELGYSASAGYKLGITDTLYVKPVAGVTGMKDADPTIAGVVLLGWGDTNGYGSVGLPYFGDNESRGMTPGISVAVKTNKVSGKQVTVLAPAFYLGDVVANLKAAAYGEIGIVEDVDGAAMAFAAGVGYDIKADDVTITPKVACRYENDKYTTSLVPGDTAFFPVAAGNYFDITASVDVTGLINNTTFSVAYVSGNLAAATAEKGSINLTAKISF